LESSKINTINEAISVKLKKLRIGAGYTSYENFALDNNLARKYYWMVESGKAKFTVEYLQKVLKIHNISLADFFDSLSE
jgi:transcriptional regulator with XRE-family HTH domain